MTLQEILKSKGLTEDDIKAINQAVDVVIESKVKTKDEEITKLNGDIKNLTDEISPVREEKRLSKLKTLLPNEADETKFNDLVKLAEISNEDDDTTIKSKLEETIKSREWLKKQAPKDLIVEKEKLANQATQTQTIKENKPVSVAQKQIRDGNL